MISEIKAILSTINIQMKLSLARATFRFIIFIQPVLYGFLMFMIFKNNNNMNLISYVILGSGILTMWSSIIFSSAGDIERERRMGTLQIITCTPISFRSIMIGKIIGNTIWGLLSIVITIITIMIFFRIKLLIVHPFLFIISSFLTIASFMSISLVLAGFFTISRNAYGLMNVLDFPIYILCGFIVPLELLPKWLYPLSYILAPTWAIKILRISVVGIDTLHIYFLF